MTPVSGRAFGRAADAGIYTRAQLLDFWYNNFISAASRKALERFFREIVVPNTADHGPEKHYFFALCTDIYVDNMISPSYFKNEYLDTFG